MKKSLLILCTAISLIYAKPAADDPELIRSRSDIAALSKNDIARMFASELAKNSPQQIDLMTVLTGATAIGETVSVQGQLSREGFEKITNVSFETANKNPGFKQELLGEIQKGQITMFCTSPVTYAVLEKGVVVTYNYFLDDYSYYGTTQVRLKDCQ